MIDLIDIGYTPLLLFLFHFLFHFLLFLLFAFTAWCTNARADWRHIHLVDVIIYMKIALQSKGWPIDVAVGYVITTQRCCLAIPPTAHQEFIKEAIINFNCCPLSLPSSHIVWSILKSRMIARPLSIVPRVSFEWDDNQLRCMKSIPMANENSLSSNRIKLWFEFNQIGLKPINTRRAIDLRWIDELLFR